MSRTPHVVHTVRWCPGQPAHGSQPSRRSGRGYVISGWPRGHTSVHRGSPSRWSTGSNDHRRTRGFRRAQATTETPTEKAARLRAQLVKQMQAAHGDLTALIGLGAIDPTVQPVLGDLDLWQKLVTTVQEINGLVFTNKPAAASLADPGPEDEEFEDEDEFGEEGGVE